VVNQKKALFVIFQPNKLPKQQELREQFSTSYTFFREMEAVEYKCWWISEEKGQWGALYVFRSQKELEDYLSSNRWLKVTPEKYGCTPTWEVMDVGLILSKTIVTQAHESWII